MSRGKRGRGPVDPGLGQSRSQRETGRVKRTSSYKRLCPSCYWSFTFTDSSKSGSGGGRGRKGWKVDRVRRNLPGSEGREGGDEVGCPKEETEEAPEHEERDTGDERPPPLYTPPLRREVGVRRQDKTGTSVEVGRGEGKPWGQDGVGVPLDDGTDTEVQ